jgi:hypothetical protein
MQASLVSMPVTAQQFSVRGLWATSPKISTITCLWLQHSWILKKAFNTTWYLGLLYKLSEFKFSISLIKFISTFIFQRLFGLGRR